MAQLSPWLWNHEEEMVFQVRSDRPTTSEDTSIDRRCHEAADPSLLSLCIMNPTSLHRTKSWMIGSLAKALFCWTPGWTIECVFWSFQAFGSVCLWYLDSWMLGLLFQKWCLTVFQDWICQCRLPNDPQIQFSNHHKATSKAVALYQRTLVHWKPGTHRYVMGLLLLWKSVIYDDTRTY